MSDENTDRNSKIYRLSTEQKPVRFTKLAKEFGISRMRIWQIICRERRRLERSIARKQIRKEMDRFKKTEQL